MRYLSIRRLAGVGLVAGALSMSVLASPGFSSASTGKASTTLTVAFSPTSVPTSVFPFYTGAQCYTVNIDYWNLMYRPGYWFGLGSSIAIQPALSPLNAPVFSSSGGDTVATITSKGWKWSNGTGGTETMSARDIIFWLNMDKAQRGQGSNAACGYVPGFGIPDQVKSVTAPGGLSGNSVRIQFTGAEAQGWLIYNELSQIDPMPVAWDITHSGGAPGSGGCSAEAWSSIATDGSDQCSTVFNYLSGLQINDSIWNWADGPYRQQSAAYASGSPTGNNVQVANADYSGPVPAKAVKTIVYKPYASTAAEKLDLEAGKLSFGYVEPTDVSSSPGPGKAGHNLISSVNSRYVTAGGVTWGVFYWEYNFNSQYSTYTAAGHPAWAGEINQQYFRAAMAESVNQPSVIKHVLNGYAVPTFSAIPAYPKNSFIAGVKNPYPYSSSKGKALLKAHGWNTKVFPAVCAINNCGTASEPINKGAQAKLTLIYPSGSTSVTNQINDEVAQIKAAADIQVVATAADASTVVGPTCFAGAHPWELCGYGGWIYAPDYYPSGEVLFATGSSSNPGGYSSSEMQGLVKATTISGNVALNGTNPTYHTSFAQWTATDQPFMWQPTPTTFGEQLKSIKGAQPPNPLGDFNPEYITAI